MSGLPSTPIFPAGYRDHTKKQQQSSRRLSLATGDKNAKRHRHIGLGRICYRQPLEFWSFCACISILLILLEQSRLLSHIRHLHHLHPEQPTAATALQPDPQATRHHSTHRSQPGRSQNRQRHPNHLHPISVFPQVQPSTLSRIRSQPIAIAIASFLKKSASPNATRARRSFPPLP